MGGSSGGQVTGYRYYMACEVTLCLGPIDEVQDILIADRSLGVSSSGSTSTYSPPTNPDFDLGDTGWDKETGWSIVTGDAAFTGTYAAKYDLNGTSGEIRNQNHVPVVQGTVVAARCACIATGNAHVAVRLFWFNSSNVEISSTQGNIVTNTAPNWFNSVVSAQVPVGAAYVCVGASATDDGAAGPTAALVDNFTWGFSSPNEIVVNQPELFGGDKREGGVAGTIEVRMGGPTQTGSGYVAQQLGVAEVPANRGLVTLLFRGDSPPAAAAVTTVSGGTVVQQSLAVASGGGTRNVGGGTLIARVTNALQTIRSSFMWAANNPYIKPVSVWAYRTHHWDSDVPVDVSTVGGVWFEATVDVPYFFDEGATYGMNPAHIIYQCLTDRRWGMGYPHTIIDDQSFKDAAQLFYDEGFGLCMIWKQQNTIKAFIQEVLRHCGASMYEDESTGLICLHPIRAESAVEFFDQYNTKAVTKFQRVSWGDTVNELVVKYTSPETGAETSVAVQDLANIQVQGRVVTQSASYPGIQYQPLAYRVADRDLRATSTPLIAATVIVNRTARALHEGFVIEWSWPEEGVVDLPMRVVKINKGDPRNPDITLELIQDVFSLSATSSGGLETGDGSSLGQYPQDNSSVNVLEVPYYKLAQQMTAAELSAVAVDDSFPLILVKQPANQNVSFNVYSSFDTVLSNFDLKGSAGYTPTAQLNGAIDQTATTIKYDTPAGASPVYFAGTTALIGSEWVSIVAVDTILGTLTVERGVLDSVPAAHADNTVIWFYAGVYGWADNSGTAVAAETVYYRETGVSALGETVLSSAPQQAHTHAASWYAPYPPGNVQINAAYFPAQVAQGDYDITWVGRNRLTQLADYIGWTEAHINEEAGTTYSLLITNAVGGATLLTETGITITSPNGLRTYTQTDNAIIKVRVRLWALRDGRSSNVYDHTFDVTRFYDAPLRDAGDSVLSTVVSGGVVLDRVDARDTVSSGATNAVAAASARTQQNDRVSSGVTTAVAAASAPRDERDRVQATATSP